MKIFLTLIIFICLIGCSVSKKNYKKYDIEKGIITYSLNYPLADEVIKQKIYFTNYGSTEYIESVKKSDSLIMPVFKKDSIEYVYVTDSMTINTNRGFDFIYEKLVQRKKSNLFNEELIILNKSDTIISDKNCELIEFKLSLTGQKGKAALWNGIPIWVNSIWEKGIYENVNLINIDLTSEIPIEKTKIMDYVDTE